MRRSSETPYFVPVAENKGFLLRAGPALYATFEGKGVIAGSDSLKPYKLDGPATPRPVASDSFPMLPQAAVEIVRMPHVV